MIFEQVAVGGCQSYLAGCAETFAAVLIDPEESQIDRYLGLATKHGLQIHYLIDTHTHADHFSATKELSLRLKVPLVMHRCSPTQAVGIRVDDGDIIVAGKLRLKTLHTPGHTADSMCLVAEDRVFTGDTLLIDGTGRTDLPTGDPGTLYDSLINRVLKLDPQLKVYPGHDYRGRSFSTIGDEIKNNPRLQVDNREAFVRMMQSRNATMPTHLTEALRVNMSGGKSVAQLLAEAAATVPFMSLEDLRARLDSTTHDFLLLDVREKDAYEAGHIPGARLLPRGQLELRVNQELPDPTQRVITCCEIGRISTLAAATLRVMGFQRAVALEAGVKAWREAGYPINIGSEP